MPIHYRACNLCEAMCGVAIEHEGGKVLSIRGDEEDPFSKGHLCPKATGLQALYEDPDRLKQPMKRVGSKWEPMSWDDALDFAAEGLHAVQRKHGRDAAGLYLGNPTVHNTGALLYASLFARALRTKHRYSATSVDQLPHMLTAYWMFGHQLLLPVPDVDRTDYLLMLGANPIASNGSLMTAPGIKRRLDELKARGGKLVVVDPRRTETAERATEHHFIRPGTDAWFLLGLLHEFFAKGAPQLRHLGKVVRGLDEVKAVAKRFPPSRVAPITGIPASTIENLARDFGSAQRAVCYGRMGTSTQAFGTLSAWLINVINVVSGNFDRPGGAMFPSPAFDPRTLPKAIAGGRGSYGRWRSRVRGLPESGGELPVATLAEDILHPLPAERGEGRGEGRIRAMVVAAGNPVLSTPNGTQLDRAFEQLEFMVSVDLYVNETSRHASVILPPPSPLEREHYDIAFHLLAVRNTARYAGPLFPAPEGQLHDWQIFLGLSKRLEALRGEGLGAKLKWLALEKLGLERALDAGLRIGPRGGRGGLSLSKLKASPHGIDLGPLEPVLPGALPEKHQTLELAPRELIADVARLEASELEERRGLKLINRRHLRDNNSWLHNAPRLISGPSRCTLLMNPLDAKERGLAAGQAVRLRSRVGEVVASLELTEAMMPGVVSLPHGYGHGRDGVRLSVAKEKPGVSVNDVSDDQHVDALSGNAAFNGLNVTVELVPSA